MKACRIHLLEKSQQWMLSSVLLQFVFIASCVAPVKAQPSIDYSVHANIIYHFSKYIDWPDDQKNGDFVIGVAGDSRIFEALQEATRNKTVGNQDIIVKRFSSTQSSYDCQILFISEDESYLLKRITLLIQGMSVLV